MAYMNKNVNFTLLFLLGAVLFALVGISTYYQKNFYNVTSEFEEKAAELRAVTEHLQLEKSRLNETSFQLTVKRSREQELSRISEDLSVEKNKLESEKQNLQADIAQRSRELVASQQENNKLTIQVSGLQDDVVKLKASADDYQAKMNRFRTQRDEACTKIAAAEKPTFCPT